MNNLNKTNKNIFWLLNSEETNARPFIVSDNFDYITFLDNNQDVLYRYFVGNLSFKHIKSNKPMKHKILTTSTIIDRCLTYRGKNMGYDISTDISTEEEKKIFSKFMHEEEIAITKEELADIAKFYNKSRIKYNKAKLLFENLNSREPQ